MLGETRDAIGGDWRIKAAMYHSDQRLVVSGQTAAAAAAAAVVVVASIKTHCILFSRMPCCSCYCSDVYTAQREHGWSI